jgi:hypothetical protein
MVIKLGTNETLPEPVEYKQNTFYFGLKSDSNMSEIEAFLATLPEVIPPNRVEEVRQKLNTARNNQATVIFLDGTIKDGEVVNCINAVQVTTTAISKAGKQYSKPVLINVNNDNISVIKDLKNSEGKSLVPSLRQLFTVLNLNPNPYLDVKTSKIIRPKYRKEILIVHKEFFMQEYVDVLDNLVGEGKSLRGVKLNLKRQGGKMSKTTGIPNAVATGKGIFSMGSLLSEQELITEYGSEEIKSKDGHLIARENSSLEAIDYDKGYFPEITKEQLILRLQDLGVLQSSYRPATLPTQQTVQHNAPTQLNAPSQAAYAPQFTAPLPVKLEDMQSDDFMTEDDIPF